MLLVSVISLHLTFDLLENQHFRHSWVKHTGSECVLDPWLWAKRHTPTNTHKPVFNCSRVQPKAIFLNNIDMIKKKRVIYLSDLTLFMSQNLSKLLEHNRALRWNRTIKRPDALFCDSKWKCSICLRIKKDFDAFFWTSGAPPPPPNPTQMQFQKGLSDAVPEKDGKSLALTTSKQTRKGF